MAETRWHKTARLGFSFRSVERSSVRVLPAQFLRNLADHKFSMFRTFSLLFAFLAVLAPGFSAGASGWASLKAGMTPDQTLVAIGRPLIRMAGRGFEVWIYDSKAEVVFHQGPVIAWTIPTPNPVSEARPIELDLPLGSPTRLPFYQDPTSRQNSADPENVPLPSTQFRFRQHR